MYFFVRGGCLWFFLGVGVFLMFIMLMIADPFFGLMILLGVLGYLGIMALCIYGLYRVGVYFMNKK